MRVVSAILINYNGAPDLPTCLDSLMRQDYPSIELVVIDNASTDNSSEILTRFLNDPRAREKFWGGSPFLISNEKNIGFSGALNEGIRRSTGDLILSLNTDIVLEPQFISELARVMEDRDVGSASGKLLRFPPGNRDNPIDSAGHIIFKNRLARNIGEGVAGSTAFLAEAQVFGTCGAAAMYSREMLEDIKTGDEYFDEDFFAFWEDVDVDWRAALRGWKCIYNPGAIAYHRRGGAGFRKPPVVEYHNLKNRYLLMIKNDSPMFFLKNLPGILFTEILKIGALLFRCPGALRALGEVVRILPSMLEKRRLVQSRRIVPPDEIEARFAPFDYRRWVKTHLLEWRKFISVREAEST